MSAILEFYFRFRFRLYHHDWHAVLHQAAAFHSNRTTYCENMASCRFFKVAAAAAQYYFRFYTCWCHCIRKVKIYQQTKFRRHISIYGWDIIISVFWKTIVRHIWILLPVSIAVISPRLGGCFVSGCRISSRRDHLLRKYNVIWIFRDGGRGHWILLPVFYSLMPLYLEGQSLSANQILSIYLNRRLTYNYFRFWKTNTHHIRILLLFSIMTISP